MNAVRTDADAGRCAFQPIEKENVFAIVGVAGDQVRGAGLEDDVAAVAADPGIVTASVARFAAGLFAEAFQRPRLAIEQKNVLLKIVVVTRQIVSSRGERDEASVGADIGRSAGVVAWTPVGGAATTPAEIRSSAMLLQLQASRPLTGAGRACLSTLTTMA